LPQIVTIAPLPTQSVLPVLGPAVISEKFSTGSGAAFAKLGSKKNIAENNKVFIICFDIFVCKFFLHETNYLFFILIAL
jgi:hypothetical protein